MSEWLVPGLARLKLNDCSEGALLPDGFALSEWQILAEAAVQGPARERRILVASCRCIGCQADGRYVG